MASPVDTSVKNHAQGSMPYARLNAPVVTGVAGSGIAMLDAVLVNGYDTVTPTSVVVSGGVCTVTTSATHSALLDDVVLIAGVTGGLTALNGEQKVTGKTATTVTFATAAANGTATGTISMKMAPLGWAKIFSGTNLAAYQSTNVASTQMVLRVDDTSTTTMRVVGYESMTDVNNGTNPFPTSTQNTGGLYWPKTNTANANPINWQIFGNSTVFYLGLSMSMGSSATQTGVGLYSFGDTVSYKTADAYRCFIMGATVSTGWSSTQGTLSNGAYLTGSYFARAYTGIGTSSPHLGASSVSTQSGNASANVYGPFPSPVDAGLITAQLFTYASTAQGLRGYHPGIWLLPQVVPTNSFNPGDRVVGAGDTAGRQLLGIFTPSGVTTAPDGVSYMFIDITGPWPS